MPQIVTCPDCGRKLKVPDNLLGKRVKCPGCGQKFVSETDDQADEAPAPRSSGVTPRAEAPARPRRRDDEDEDDDDRPASRRRDAEEEDEEEDEDYPVKRRRDEKGPEPSKADVVTGWERVRFGLNLIVIGLWILVGSVVLAGIGYMILAVVVGSSISSMAGGAPPGGPMTQQQINQMAGRATGTFSAAIIGGCLLWGLLGLLALAYAAVTTTGMGFCMAVAPTRKASGLKGLAIAAFSCGIAFVVLPTLTFGAETALARNGGGCVVIPGYGLGWVVFLAELICFMLFLRGVAGVMKKDGLAQNVLLSMIGNVIYWLLMLVMPFVMAFALGAALFSSFASAGSRNVPGAVGNAAGTGAAFVIGGIVCSALMFLIGLGLFIWYMVLVHQVRSAVSAWLDRN